LFSVALVGCVWLGVGVVVGLFCCVLVFGFGFLWCGGGFCLWFWLVFGSIVGFWLVNFG
jgi:hypothetical protein